MTGPDEPTTRGDFPGGPRTEEERELFAYVKRLIALRRELEPLRTGKLRNLYVAEQQYAYARGEVIVAINNDDQPAEISFATELREGILLHDRLGASGDVVVNQGRIRASLPKRSAAIFVKREQ
jgi:hypothetical protein